jgi:hypothetical protein
MKWRFIVIVTTFHVSIIFHQMNGNIFEALSTSDMEGSVAVFVFQIDDGIALF